MSDQVTIIQPSTKWKFINLHEVWRYRELLMTFVKRDIMLRYRQTMIGATWAIIQPLTTMVIFSFFFGKLAKMPSDGVPYPIFSYAGLLLWTYFSGALTGAANSMVANSNLITKVYFPRILVPLSATLNGMLDYAISFIIMFGLMFYYHTPLSPTLLLLPLVLMLTWMLSSGIGFWLASINVKYRDVRYVIPFFLQLLLYITPVIYPASVAERFKLILALNPMTGLIETHRALILSQSIPWNLLSLSVVLTLILFVSGAFYFKQMEKNFADVI